MSERRRAAVYARFSTDLQNDRSIADQTALCHDYAAKAGLTVLKNYEDRAQSSATLFGREGLLSLIADAKGGQYDVIVVEALDRISRNPADLHGLFQTLDFAGVSIEEVHRGRADALAVGLSGLVGQMFLDGLKEKTRRGLAGVVRDGRSAGGKAYGYAPVPGKPGHLTILEDEAGVIRRIFTEYAAGESTRDIIARLNNEGIASPRGSAWRSTALTGNRARHYGILFNDLYRGQRIWNRVRMVRDPETGKRVSRINPESDWQHQDVPELRIIPEALWKAVQFRLDRSGGARARVNKKPKRPLAGLLRCDGCGGNMTIRARRKNGSVYVSCTNATDARTCDQRSNVRLDQIEEAIFAQLGKLLHAPEYLKEYIAAYHDERKRLAKESGRSREDLERDASRSKRAYDRARDLYIKGITDGPEAEAEIRDLKEKAATAARALAETEASTAVIAIHPLAKERYLSAINDLSKDLDNISDPTSTAAVTAVRELISEVHVSKQGEQVTATVFGHLGALLAPELSESDGSVRRT